MAVSKTFIGIGLALASASFYSFNPPFAALAAFEGFPVYNAVLMRALGLFLLICSYFAFIRKWPKVPAENWPPLIAVGLGSTCLSLGYLYSVNFIPVGLAVTIFYTFPVVIVLISPFIDGNPFSVSRLIIALIASAGIVIAIGGSLEQLDWRGIMLAGLASLGATAMFFASARIVQTTDVLTISFWSHLVILPFALLCTLQFSDISAFPVSSLGWAAFIIICVGYIYGFVYHIASVKYAPPALVGVFFSIEPVITFVIAAIILSERLTVNQYIGSAIVIAAVFAISLLEAYKALRNQEDKPDLALAPNKAVVDEPTV